MIYIVSIPNSADYMQALAMKFTSKEDAVAFADKQGKKNRNQFTLRQGDIVLFA